MVTKHIVSLTADNNQHNSYLSNNINTNNLQEFMSNGFVNPELIPKTGYGKVIISFQKGVVVDIKQEISLKPSDIIKNYRKPVIK